MQSYTNLLFYKAQFFKILIYLKNKNKKDSVVDHEH